MLLVGTCWVVKKNLENIIVVNGEQFFLSMNGLSTNVQCCGDLHKRSWIMYLCNVHWVNFIAIQETKAMYIHVWSIHQLWGTFFYFACSSTRSFSEAFSVYEAL